MTRDRLAALRAVLSSDDDDFPVLASPLDGLFERADSIRLSVAGIRAKVEEVKRKHDEILCAVGSDGRQKEELEELMEEVKTGSQKVRVQLRQLKLEEECDGTVARIKATQVHSLETAFVEAMAEYNADQEKYMQRYKDKMRRPFEILGKEVTDEELDEMVAQKDVKIFFPDIIETQKMRQAVADIEARHADIVKLEKSIMELHDMFMEMALLVEQQGELVDRIEYHVERAAEDVRKGTEDTAKAKGFLDKYRKKRLMLIICVLILVVILASTVFPFIL